MQYLLQWQPTWVNKSGIVYQNEITQYHDEANADDRPTSKVTNTDDPHPSEEANTDPPPTEEATTNDPPTRLE